MWVSLAAVWGVSSVAPFPFFAPSLRMPQPLLAQTFSFLSKLSILHSLLPQTFSKTDRWAGYWSCVILNSGDDQRTRVT